MEYAVPGGAHDLPFQLSPVPIRNGSYVKRSQERAHHRRAAMRAVARTVLAERGYAGVHMRDLADRCGVSPQTLYNNLGSREDILHSAIDELLCAQIRHATIVSRRGDRNFMLAFCNLTAQLFELDHQYVDAIITLLTATHDRPPLAVRFEQRCIEAYTAHLQSMQRLGAIKPWVDVDTLARTMQDSIRNVLADHVGSCSGAQRLRDELTLNVGLLLLGVARDAEAARIEAVVRELFVRRRGRVIA